MSDDGVVAGRAWPELAIGQVVQTIRPFLNTPPGTYGVVYSTYELHKRPGWDVLFTTGFHDGFSPRDVDLLLVPTADFIESMRNYQFTNVGQLRQDLEHGRIFPADFPDNLPHRRIHGPRP